MHTPEACQDMSLSSRVLNLRNRKGAIALASELDAK